MIEQHNTLLGTIEDAEKQAIALYNKGARVESVVKRLREAKAVIVDRLKVLRTAPPKPVKPPVTPKQPAAQKPADAKTEVPNG